MRRQSAELCTFQSVGGKRCSPRSLYPALPPLFAPFGRAGDSGGSPRCAMWRQCVRRVRQRVYQGEIIRPHTHARAPPPPRGDEAAQKLTFFVGPGSAPRGPVAGGQTETRLRGAWEPRLQTAPQQPRRETRERPGLSAPPPRAPARLSALSARRGRSRDRSRQPRATCCPGLLRLGSRVSPSRVSRDRKNKKRLYNVNRRRGRGAAAPRRPPGAAARAPGLRCVL